MTKLKKVRPTSPPDYVFIGALILIVLFGFVMLASASSDIAKLRFNDSYHYLKQQIVNGLGVGLVGLLFASFLFYRRWERLAMPILGISILFLLLVFTPLGFSAKGSARWVDLGFVVFQPGELLKLTFLLYLALWISKNAKRGSSLSEGFLPLLVLMGVVGFLLIEQPSTTTAVVILLASIAMYYAAGARFRFLALMGCIGVLGFSLLIYFTPYRFQRILTFLQPEKVDVLGEGYHISQSLTAIGSGGLFGVGYGNSTTKLFSLPEPIGDSIFAVIAEELGFVGASALLFLFFVLVVRGFMIARQAPDLFAKLLALGFSSLIAIQVFINVGAISGVLPLTGVPLPFISFGGTALAVFLTMSGIIINVSRYRR